MAKTEVEINIKTISAQAVKDLTKVGDTAGGITKKFEKFTKESLAPYTELKSALSLVKSALNEVGQAYDTVIGKTVEYAQQVKDMSRVTGDTAEATSRLIQAGDDVRLSFDEMRTSMQIASKQGIDVTADGIANLADEYLKLNPGVDRAQFLLTTFGRSGAAMGRLLEQGGAGVRKMYAAVDDGLIMTDDAIEKAEEYRIAIDELGEAWEGFRNIVAVEILPQLVDIIRLTTGVAEAFPLMFSGDWQGAADAAAEAINKTQWATEDAKAAMENAPEAISEIQEPLENVVSPAQDYADALQEVAKGWKDLKDAQQSWLESTANEIAGALDGLWLSEDKQKEALRALDEMYGTNEEGELEHKEAIEEMTRAYAQTGDIDTFKEALRGLKDEELPQTTEQLEAARKKANDLELQLQTLKNMSPIHVKIILDQEGEVPAFGGGSGYWAGVVGGNSTT